MKNEKWIGAFWATLLAFTAAFGSMGCVITAFNLEAVSVGWVAFACALGAVVFSLIYPRGWIPLGILTLLSGHLWHKGPLEKAVEGLVYHISCLYDLGYGWGTVSWSQPEPIQADPTLALCILGILVAAAVAWTVSGRHTVWAGILAAVLPFGSCLVLTNTVPAVGYLGLFMVSLCLLLMTQPIRRTSPKSGNTLTAMIAVPVAAAVVFLLLLCPQKAYHGQKGADRIEDFVMNLFGLEELAESTSVLGNNTSNTISLSAAGPRKNQNHKVITLRSAKSGAVYLRGCAYDTYDGTNWSRSEGPWAMDGEYAVIGTGFAVNVITMQPHDVKYMPQVVPQMLKNMNRGRVENANGGTRYQYVCTDLPRYEPIWEDEGGSVSANTAAQYLQLPEETALWAKNWLAQNVGSTQVGNSAGAIWRYASNIAQIVESSASYDLQTKSMPEGGTDFARWFLEDSDTGYCVHFATATTVLLRSAGIPARYVTGYLVNAQSHENVSVRLRDAHAWVEIYLANVGWVVLEATPGGNNSPVTEQTEGVEQFEETTVETQTVETTETILETTEEITAATEPEETLPVIAPIGGADGPTDPSNLMPEETGGKGWLWCLLAVAILLMIIAQWQLRLWLRRKKQHTGTTNAQALARWKEVRLHARLHGEMPEELLELAQKARFSQHTLTRQELHVFTAYLTQSRKQLQKKSLWHKLYHTLILAIY